MDETGCMLELVSWPSQSAEVGGRPKEVQPEPVVYHGKGPERSNKGHGSSRISSNSYPRGTNRWNAPSVCRRGRISVRL